jgi:hypothetical protein
LSKSSRPPNLSQPPTKNRTVPIPIMTPTAKVAVISNKAFLPACVCHQTPIFNHYYFSKPIRRERSDQLDWFNDARDYRFWKRTFRGPLYYSSLQGCFSISDLDSAAYSRQGTAAMRDGWTHAAIKTRGTLVFCDAYRRRRCIVPVDGFFCVFPGGAEAIRPREMPMHQPPFQRCKPGRTVRHSPA